MNSDKPHIGLIVGPTASGKTAASICLAKMLDGEIVSADSIQVYKGLDIGSAKPTMEERGGIPHHMMDAIEPSYAGFSVAEYQQRATKIIDEILKCKKYPLVVGGSGLYINSLTYPLNFTSIPSDDRLRNELVEIEANSKGALYKLLTNEDPGAAARLHPNDIKRIIRALEVVRLSGKGLDQHGGDFNNQKGDEIPYLPKLAGITMPREMLYERINRRVDIMIETGLIQEARQIYDSGLDLSLPALQGLGYRQLFRHFAGQCSLSESIQAIKQETRHFAKRQITWFKRDTRIVWFDASEYDSPQALANSMYQKVFSEV